MSDLYYIGRSGHKPSMVIVAEDFHSYLEQMLDSGGLPPGSYWIQKSTQDANSHEAVHDWGIIEVHINGRWMVQTGSGIFGPE